MTETQPNSAITRQIVALLSHYGFDLRGYTAEKLAFEWLSLYHEHWVRLAVIEALYQGRYKAVSVEQILTFWGRKQHPVFHFNHEFERLICRKLPRHLNAINDPWYEDSIQEDEDYDSLYSYWSDRHLNVLSDTLEADQLVSDPTVATDPESEPHPSEDLKTEETSPKPPYPFTPKTSSEDEELQPTIHHFKPSPDASNVYQKLKSVAQHSLEKKAQ